MVDRKTFAEDYEDEQVGVHVADGEDGKPKRSEKGPYL